MRMDLRVFQESDASQLTDMLHRAYAELGAAGMNFTAVDQDLSTTLRRASAGSTWVIADGAALVAAMTISWPAEAALRELTAEAATPGRAWLNQLAVDPSRRGEGHARRLRDVGFAWCLTRGVTSIGLDTAETADHLVGIYRGWGFSTVDTVQWPGKTYRSVIMTRSLASARPVEQSRRSTDRVGVSASRGRG